MKHYIISIAIFNMIRFFLIWNKKINRIIAPLDFHGAVTVYTHPGSILSSAHNCFSVTAQRLSEQLHLLL